MSLCRQAGLVPQRSEAGPIPAGALGAGSEPVPLTGRDSQPALTGLLLPARAQHAPDSAGATEGTYHGNRLWAEAWCPSSHPTGSRRWTPALALVPAELQCPTSCSEPAQGVSRVPMPAAQETTRWPCHGLGAARARLQAAETPQAQPPAAMGSRPRPPGAWGVGLGAPWGAGCFCEHDRWTAPACPGNSPAPLQRHRAPEAGQEPFPLHAGSAILSCAHPQPGPHGLAPRRCTVWGVHDPGPRGHQGWVSRAPDRHGCSLSSRKLQDRPRCPCTRRGAGLQGQRHWQGAAEQGGARLRPL